MKALIQYVPSAKKKAPGHLQLVVNPETPEEKSLCGAFFEGGLGEVTLEDDGGVSITTV
jgi:hypothetical protein